MEGKMTSLEFTVSILPWLLVAVMFFWEGWKSNRRFKPLLTRAVGVEAVAVVRRDGDGAHLEWLTEGGVDGLPRGIVLMISDAPLTNDDGEGVVHVGVKA